MKPLTSCLVGWSEKNKNVELCPAHYYLIGYSHRWSVNTTVAHSCPELQTFSKPSSATEVYL